MKSLRSHDLARDRALGALLGVAIGDAMGMPTQSLNRDQIRATYGRISDLVAAASNQPVSAGLAAGTITDDTEQSLLLAAHLIERHGAFDENAWALALTAWERGTRERGIHDLLGPSTKRAIDALARGVPASETGRHGTTNGAAMRITPVGLAMPLHPLKRFVERVEETCRVTHNTGEAIGAAAAVAAVVSAGVDGASFEDAIPLAIEAARMGETRGHGTTPAHLSSRIEDALVLARRAPGIAAVDGIAAKIGTSVAAVESVPMAFAIARLADAEAWQAAVVAANIGGDTDTIGAIACGMCAACAGSAALPQDKVDTVIAINRLDLGPVVAGLLRLRSRAAASPEDAP